MSRKSQNGNMTIKGKYLDEILQELYGNLWESDNKFHATKGQGRDLLGQKITLANPRARISATVTRGRLISALGEFCWYMSGSADIKFIRFYVKDYPPKNANGLRKEAYGPRFKGTGKFGYKIDQVNRVIKKLKKNSDTRRAVITLLESSDLEPRKKEAPCTFGLQFIRRRGLLHLIVMMRSNDAYLGFPHDVFCFTMIQELIARTLGDEVGEYHHFATSLHLYDNDKKSVEDYLDEGFQNPRFQMPEMPPGCQIESLQEFLKVEKLIRCGTILRADQISLPEYWKDLALVLLRCADSRHGRGDKVLKENFSHIKNSFYKSFFMKRPKTLQKNVNKKVVQYNLDLRK